MNSILIYNPTILRLFSDAGMIFTKLSVVVAQGQKYRALSENWTHWKWSANHHVRYPKQGWVNRSSDLAERIRRNFFRKLRILKHRLKKKQKRKNYLRFSLLFLDRLWPVFVARWFYRWIFVSCRVFLIYMYIYIYILRKLIPQT